MRHLLVGNMVNIYYEPDAVLSASHILIHKYVHHFVIILMWPPWRAVWTPHTTKMWFKYWDYCHYIHTMRAWRTLLHMKLKSLRGARPVSQADPIWLQKSKKRDCLTVFLMTRWYCGGWEFSYMRWACVAWIFHQFQRMQDIPRLLR